MRFTELKAHLREQLHALGPSRLLFVKKPDRRAYGRRHVYFGSSKSSSHSARASSNGGGPTCEKTGDRTWCSARESSARGFETGYRACNATVVETWGEACASPIGRIGKVRLDRL